MKRLVTSNRLLLSLVAMAVINVYLDGDDGDEGSRQLQISDARPRASTEPQPSLGSHYVTLYVGVPAQPQHLLVSLASDYTSFPCQGCENCGDNHSPFFDFSNSYVHQCSDSCEFKQSRCEDGTESCIVTSSQLVDEDTEASYRGFEVRDTVYLDTTGHVPKNGEGFILDFVCQSQVRGRTLNSPNDGVLSLSMAESSFISQLVKRKKLRERKFSLCFNRQDGYQDEGTSIGSIQLGEVDRKHHTSSLIWASNKGKASHSNANYAVKVKKLYMGIGGGNHPLIGASQGTMSIIPLGKNIDVFTPPEAWLAEAVIKTNKANTQLPKNFEEAFESAFAQLMGVAYDANGILLANRDIASLPTLFIQLEPHLHEQAGVPSDLPGFAGKLDTENPYDVLLAIPPHNYFIYDPETNVAIPTVSFSERITHLGANVFQGHEVVFDLDNSRIGFAEHSLCEDSLSIKPLANPSLKGELTDGSATVPRNSTKNSTGGGTLVTADPEDGSHGGTVVSADPDGLGVSEFLGVGEPNATNATNATIVVGGGAPPASERQNGIPPADGRGTFHAGLGAVRAAEALERMNRHKGVGFDYFHFMGFAALIASFAITAFATRDRNDSRIDKNFKQPNTPMFYSDPDLEQNAWQQPMPAPDRMTQEPQRLKSEHALEMEEGSQEGSEDQSSVDDSQKEDPEQPRMQRRSFGLQLWSASTRELYKQEGKESGGNIAEPRSSRQSLFSSGSTDASTNDKPLLFDDRMMTYDQRLGRQSLDEQSRGSIDGKSRDSMSRKSLGSMDERSRASMDGKSLGSMGWRSRGFKDEQPRESEEEQSRYSDTQSQFSEESNASYFVKKPSSKQHTLATVEETSTEILPLIGSEPAHSAPGRTHESVNGSEWSFSQRTPAGAAFLDGSDGSSRRASSTTTGSTPSAFNYSSSEGSLPSRQPAGVQNSGNFAGMAMPAGTAEGTRDVRSIESAPFSNRSSSSLPGMGTTSSLPGIGGSSIRDSVSSPGGSVAQSSSARSHATSSQAPASQSASYEVEEEEEEEEEDEDYFPGPDQLPFIPGVSNTGVLFAHREADDDRSLLTMEEFPDSGSVSTRETTHSREEASQAATQVSEDLTALRGNTSRGSIRYRKELPAGRK